MGITMELKLCKRCIIPLEKDLSEFIPRGALPIKEENESCNICSSLEKDEFFNHYFGENTIFKKEFEDFLNDKKRVIFAYSGGLDSTVVLDKLNTKCKEKGIELICFTVDHGFKGKKSKENIENVLEFEGLKNNHYWIDISKHKLENGKTVEEFYLDFINNNELPCGKNCNKIIDSVYKKFLDGFDDKVLITGGDTPKYNLKLGRYSIFWENNDYTVLRGAIAFGLSKKKNEEIIGKENIPWKNTGCGGYDTDCLLPGAILKRITKNKQYSFEGVIKEMPVILEYFSERVRWQIINREDATKSIYKIETPNISRFNEFKEIIYKIE